MLALLSAICFGSGGIFIRYAYQAGVLPGMAVFLRFLIAALVLLVFLSFSGGWMPLSRRQTLTVFLMGLLGFSVMGTTVYVALSYIPVWLAALFTSFYPIVVNLGGWLFLKEQISGRQVLALAAVIGGCVLLFWQPFESVAWQGLALMILNVMAVSLYILLGQRFTRGIPPTMNTAWTTIGATLGTLIYALAAHEFSFSFALTGWLWAFCFAVISTVLSITLLWGSMSLIGSSRATIIGSFEPLFGVILAVLLLDERLSGWQMMGGLFILIGVFLVQWQPRFTPGR